MNITDTDAESINLLTLLSDSTSGRSTPSNMAAMPIQFGYTKLYAKCDIQPKIRDSEACLETYMNCLDTEEQTKIRESIKQEDKPAITDIMTRAVTAHALKRFFEGIPAYDNSTKNNDLVIINDGIVGLNNWVEHKSIVYKMQLSDVHTELNKVSDSMLTEMTLPVLERLGMTDKVAAHLQDKRDRLMLLTDFISAGSIASRTKYVGAPLFVGLAIIYQMYDVVDICVFGDTLLFEPKCNPYETSTELMGRMSFIDMVTMLTSNDVIDGHRCDVTQIDDYHQYTFYVDVKSVVATKKALMDAATIGNLDVAKAKSMKLAYFAWAASTEVDAYDGLNGLFIDIPDAMIDTGVSMRYHSYKETSIDAHNKGYSLAPKDYGPYGEAFEGTRALIETIGPAIRRPLRQARMKRYAGSPLSYDKQRSIRIISDTLNVWAKLHQTNKPWIDGGDGWET